MRRVSTSMIALAMLVLICATAPAVLAQSTNCLSKTEVCNALPAPDTNRFIKPATDLSAMISTPNPLPNAPSATPDTDALPAGAGGYPGGGGGSDNRDHIELGAFVDYLRLHHANDTGFWGLGGRIGFGVASHVNIEAQMAYDFERNITTTGNVLGTSFTQVNGLRLLHGMFGPMVWFGSKHARAFVEAKGGFLNFSVSGASAPSGFSSSIGNFTSGDTNGAFFPGGGIEFSAGPIGLRADVGDLMYFDNGANHNLVIQVGPSFHF